MICRCTARDNLESFVNGLLNASPFGAVLQAVTASGSYNHLIDRYIHDYTQLVYTPHSKLPDEELQVLSAISCVSSYTRMPPVEACSRHRSNFPCSGSPSTTPSVLRQPPCSAHACMLHGVAFSALTLLVGRQEGHLICKKWGDGEGGHWLVRMEWLVCLC